MIVLAHDTASMTSINLCSQNESAELLARFTKNIDIVKQNICAPWNCASSKETTETLNSIRKEFVVTPIDIRNGKVALTCERFYSLVLKIGLGKDEIIICINTTYVWVNKTSQVIFC